MTPTVVEPEVTDMRRMRLINWTDPKKIKGGPTLTVKGVMRLLEYKAPKPVYILTEKGPENGGFPGYIRSPEGEGWIRKTAPANGSDLMYYRSDIEAWALANPKRKDSERPEPVPYTEDERGYVLYMAERVRVPGGVPRKKLRALLETINYVEVKYVDDQTARGWLIPIAPDLATLFVSKDDQRSVLIPAVDIEIIKKGNTEGAWNVRAYSKLRQILNDAGIGYPPLNYARHKGKETAS